MPTSVEIDGIGKVNATAFKIAPFNKQLSITKIIDGTSNTIARWHKDVVLDASRRGGVDDLRSATLTQLDAKRTRELCSLTFSNVVPVSLSLSPDPGAKAGVQRTIETLVLAFEGVKIKVAPADVSAQLTSK